MLESLAEWMSFPLYYAYDGAAPPPRAGASHVIVQGIRHGQFHVCNIDQTSQCLLSMISGVTKTVDSVNAMDRSVTESIAMLCRRLMQTQ